MPTPSPPQPDYGLDGPRGLALLLVVCVGSIAAASWLHESLGLSSWFILLIRIVLLVLAADCLLLTASLLCYSKIVKRREAERLLDLVPWRGAEEVLDVGCGRGLLLIAAARRLKGGRAVGMDAWRRLQLSGNRAQATIENARRAGVADRVEVHDGDARRLPFANASFDVVISSLVLHNIPSGEGRRQAVREIARVLRPGGYVALLDARHTRAYVNVLRACGLVESRRHKTGWVLSVLFPMLSCGLMRFYRVTARKPLEVH